MTRNVPAAATRVAHRAAAEGRRLVAYNRYKNAINALSTLRVNQGNIREYRSGGRTYRVYGIPQRSNNPKYTSIRRRIRPVLNNNLNMSTRYNLVMPHLPARIPGGRHGHLANTFKSENAINQALNRYYNTHVAPELIREIGNRTPGVRSAAGRLLTGARQHTQRKANLRDYHIFLEGLYKAKQRNRNNK